MIIPQRLTATRFSDRSVVLLLLLVHLCILWLRVGFVLLHPSEYLLAPVGDGIKTYFALLYYVQYDKGLLFTGMNYPYGEYLIYTDGFPLLAWLLAAWKSFFGLSKASMIGVFNLTVLLSSLPTTLIVYKIARHYQVGQLLAACATLGIVFLSPQWHRLGGHLTLTISFVVPLLWYIQILLMEATSTHHRARWLLVYVLTAVLLSLVHPYYLLHALLLPAATGIVQMMQQVGRTSQPWRTPLWLFAAGVFPTLLLRGWIFLVDPITDRPTNPYGFFVYRTNVASVFGPVIDPFTTVFSFIFHTEAPIWEGYAYIGLPVVLGLLLLTLRLVTYAWRRRFRRILTPVFPRSLRPSVWASALILLFAMGWPFIFPGFDRLLDWLPSLKQFRSLGRFAWIFYYIMAITTLVQYQQLYRLFRQRHLARFGLTVICLLLLLWGVEAKYQVAATTNSLREARVANRFISPNTNYFALLSAAGHSPTQFQALLPLPYYSIGSEKFDLSGTEISHQESFRASLNLHLPIMGAMMARSSTTHALRLIEMLASDLNSKKLLTQLPSTKPLLVVASRQDALSPAESALLARGAQQLLQTDVVTLYSLPLSAFTTKRPAAERTWFTDHKASLVKEGNLWRTTPGPAIVWRSFTNSPAQAYFTQPGAAHSSRGPLLLYAGPLPGATDTTSYELSVWAYAKTSDWLPLLRYRQLNAQGNEVERREESLKTSTEIHGDWVRFSYPIRLKAPENYVEVTMEGADILVDDLLIRPRATNVYWLDSRNQPVLNGYPLTW